MTYAADLVVLSHLRWTFVWQRPQHLVSRFAAERAAEGGRTWFVEEPVFGDVDAPRIEQEERDGILRVWVVIPTPDAPADPPGFDAPAAEAYPALLARHLREQGLSEAPRVLVYTPMALELARSLRPGLLAYDVMDDLASFRAAPLGLRNRQHALLEEADVLFAGGRSLYEGVVSKRPVGSFLFPSGVESAHYASSRELRARRDPAERRVAGYVGVLDERLDLGLIERLAAALPDWTLRMVGPVVKIAPDSLPQAPNIEYPGMADYRDLPAVMAGFDVALMPFALNEATRSISPTKTLEYLAAGLPVVSTRVADVVADYDGTVHFADTAEEFAAACEEVVAHPQEERDRRMAPIQERHDWGRIAEAMSAVLADALRARREEDAAEDASLAADLEEAHRRGVGAAVAGLQDAALGAARLSGPGVPRLAEAGLTSAAPFLRAPLLSRLSAAARLHPSDGFGQDECPTCGTPVPCATASALRW